MPKEILMPVKIGDITFKNPFYVASGPTTKSVRQLVEIERTGWAAASIKLTIDPAPYVNRVPRYAIFNDRNALCFTVEKRLKFSEGLKLVTDAKKELKELLLMANITYAGDEGTPGWVNMAKKFEEAGADIIELNMCCPNMSYNLELTTGNDGASAIRTGASLGQHGGAVAEIVRAIKQAVSIPVYVKLTPEGGNIAKVAKELYEAGADVVGGTANRMGIPPINLEDPAASAYHLQDEISMSCHSGAWLKPLAQRDAYEIRKINGPGPRISAAGGIRNYKDAIEMVMCGADILGICAETLISGYGFIGGLISDMKSWMDAHGYKDIMEFRDRIVPEVKTALEVTLYKGHAHVKENLAAPCKSACPQHVPAQAYVRKVAKGEYKDAYNLITQSAPLQGVCSLVCNHACETACTRGMGDSPVHIREIKRFVLDTAEKNGWTPEIKISEKKNKRVAVIGSGPAGLSNAFYLAKEGFLVTVFEREDKPGGMLSQVLPEFRIPGEVIDNEVKTLKAMGVEFKLGCALGRDFTLDSLKAEGFSSIFIGVGAQKERALNIPGENTKGVYHTLDFLKRVKNGNAPEIGKTAVILGGGFSAVDAARTAVRLGAEKVYIAYRRTKDEMPATPDEVAEAEAEGIRIMYLVSPVSIEAENGRLSGVHLKNQVLGEEDSSGRRSPEAACCETFTLPCDTLISAIGQLAEDIQCVEAKSGCVSVNPLTLETNIENVYAGGDAVNVNSVIAAVAAGKRAAQAMTASMTGQEFTPEPLEIPTVNPEAVLERNAYFRRGKRASVITRPGPDRARDFEIYTRVLTEDEAIADANRCLSCGCGEGCQICRTICCDFAVDIDGPDRVKINEKDCVACGMCYNRCPNKNIEMINLQEKV